MTLDLRCSTWARSQLVDPIGTAGTYNGFLLCEWPLPWPADVSEVPQFVEIARSAQSLGIRVQAVVPHSAIERKVALYKWDGARSRYVGVEAPFDDGSASTALDLMAGPSTAGSTPIDAVDLLVCTHGTRDRCCGSLGTSLHRALQTGDRFQADKNVRIRRTSHTGGHRFAPTALLFPEGTSWGYLDPSLVRQIVERSGAFNGVSGLYRGCGGLGSPEVQAIERAVLCEVGWSLLDLPRGGENSGDGRVSFEARDPIVGLRRWQGRVVKGRVLPVPKCGVAVTGTEKIENELVVTDLLEVASDRV